MEMVESPRISRLLATEVEVMDYRSDESRPQEVFRFGGSRPFVSSLFCFTI